MHTKGGSPVAFVEYQDIRYAAQAMATLQGSLLVSSDRGAIRIEYAKSKMAEVGLTNLWIEVGSIFFYDGRAHFTESYFAAALDTSSLLFSTGLTFLLSMYIERKTRKPLVV